MKIVVQTFRKNENPWFLNLIEQFSVLCFEIIVVESGAKEEKIYKDPERISVIHIETPENLWEYISFKKVHQYIKHHFIESDMYLFMADTCELGPEFEEKVMECYETLKATTFDYAPIPIDRTRRGYMNGYKCKFNICFMSYQFMHHPNFRTLFYSNAFAHHTNCSIELGMHRWSFRRWNSPSVNVNQSLIDQVHKSEQWIKMHGSNRVEQYIEKLDLYKYLSDAYNGVRQPFYESRKR
tara:strand:- start:112 stop:828 length:717 start_codon:yes stop_codon:yes gene_type:complete